MHQFLSRFSTQETILLVRREAITIIFFCNGFPTVNRENRLRPLRDKHSKACFGDIVIAFKEQPHWYRI